MITRVPTTVYIAWNLMQFDENMRILLLLYYVPFRLFRQSRITYPPPISHARHAGCRNFYLQKAKKTSKNRAWLTFFFFTLVWAACWIEQNGRVVALSPDLIRFRCESDCRFVPNIPTVQFLYISVLPAPQRSPCTVLLSKMSLPQPVPPSWKVCLEYLPLLKYVFWSPFL